MGKITCYLRLSEVPLHLYQVISGFMMLERQGIIELKYEKLKKGHPDLLPYNMMEVIINQKTKVLYDVNDGYDNLLQENKSYVEFYNNLLSRFDLCFKRSFSKKYNSLLDEKEKIYPLGLNYMVTYPNNIAHFPMPNDPVREKIKKIARMLPFSEYYNGLYYVNSFEDTPRLEENPRILFMTRLWDIDGDYEGQLSSIKKEERKYINEVRAKCIKLCKKEFGESFFGGVASTKYTNENYSDIIIEDSSITKRNNYIKRVKGSSICVATMGLHESIGWKFAEYVAASKAIVTEELHYEIPSDFTQNKNYLTFKTPRECIEQIYKLVNDDNLRYKMMLHNFEYYHQHVRADRLILNSILLSIENGFQNMYLMEEAL